MIDKEFKDQLRIEGILSKGFGHIAKFVATDTDLTIEALAIYGYFSSFAGGGNTAFPSRSKILSDLNISKDRYYNHYNLLLKEGYITTERERYYHEEKKKWVLGNNIYTLISNPKKFQEQALKENDDDKGHSRIRNSGMKSLGYGTVPKAVMLDRRLDIQAKGIYVYFCGFAGSGNSAFPKLKNILYHLQISEKTYYKYYNQLVKANYIEVEQRQINGRLGVNDYYLTENPDEEIAKEIAKKRVKVDIKPILPFSKNQDIQKQDIQKQDIQKQDIQKQDIYNTNRTNTNRTNINSFGSVAKF
ncbi:helix-turn-helix domain-containing protein [Streptococcus parasuis]|uniref:helix-turn-helix domain-containing protein n=1 Tax=Streptococcus parasuis TaxID=1501662 RepID=UPI00370DA774